MMTDPKKHTSVPNLRAIPGIRGENRAKANNGREVIVPAKVFEICRLSRIKLTNGPTEVKGARKFAAINKIPIISITGAAFVTQVLDIYENSYDFDK